MAKDFKDKILEQIEMLEEHKAKIEERINEGLARHMIESLDIQIEELYKQLEED